MAFLRLENVSMGYFTGREVLRDVSFDILPGSFHFIAGASGAGKSSLLGLLALMHRTSRGRIWMFGKEVSRINRESLPRFRRRIGVVFQDFQLLDHLTVEENVGLPLKIMGEPPAQIRSKVKDLLEWAGLAAYHRAKPEILSGGQKQRAAIARAVIHTPEILLADEPSGNLDPSLSLKFMYLFEQLHKDGTTILYATHDDHLISKFNYPVLQLKDGQLHPR